MLIVNLALMCVLWNNLFLGAGIYVNQTILSSCLAKGPLFIAETQIPSMLLPMKFLLTARTYARHGSIGASMAHCYQQC